MRGSVHAYISRRNMNSKQITEAIDKLLDDNPGAMPSSQRTMYEVTRGHTLALWEIARQIALHREYTQKCAYVVEAHETQG